MDPVASESFHYTKQQVDALRSLLATNSNCLAAVWWQVEQWWPKASTDMLLDFVEDVRDGKFDDWEKLVCTSDHVTFSPS